jgi:hypothetical protein
MADQGIKKYRVPYSSLPAINSSSEGYTLKYRIVSEDKNRVSHWSPITLVQPNYTYVQGQIRHLTGGQTSSFTWDSIIMLKDIKSVQAITNKVLNTNLATLTTSGAHYMNVGDWVTVDEVDSVFNGTYQISAVTTNTFSYYKNHGNVGSTAVSPNGIYITNSLVRTALEYDIWIRWDRNDGGDWIYKERIESTSISYPHPSFYTINGAVQPSAPNRVSIEVYLRGYPIVRGDGLPLATGTPFLKVYQLLDETI